MRVTMAPPTARYILGFLLNKPSMIWPYIKENVLTWDLKGEGKDAAKSA